MHHWLWQHPKWPEFYWDNQVVSKSVAKTRQTQGQLQGTIQLIQQDKSEQLNSQILAEQAIDTSAIEGETLNRASVRSSIAKRLGLERAGVDKPSDRYIEGLLDMLIDATSDYQHPLTVERLYGWHAALFPTGYSGIRKIAVAQLRDTGPMQIVSGRPGKETVHYQAPPAETLPDAMQAYLNWFNQTQDLDGLIRAGIAHLWYELLHPFDDGNGRIGRAIIDLALAQDEQQPIRFYSVSSAIMSDRKQYYAVLEQSCQGELDITAWLVWFLDCLESAMQNSLSLIKIINKKALFWQKHSQTSLNQRQIKVLNKLLDAGESGFTGGMTTKKYMHMTKTSRATAYRELNDLVNKGCLQPTADKGRSAAYELIWPL